MKNTVEKVPCSSELTWKALSPHSTVDTPLPLNEGENYFSSINVLWMFEHGSTIIIKI
jgi:hypothetical protein